MKKSKVKILSINFTLLKYSGVWRPSSFDNSIRKAIYSLYTYLVMFVVISLILQKCVVILTTTNSLDDLIEHLFLFLEISCIIVKAINFILMRRKIELALQLMINNGLYNQPLNHMEIDWRATTDRKSRFAVIKDIFIEWKYLKIFNFAYKTFMSFLSD